MLFFFGFLFYIHRKLYVKICLSQRCLQLWRFFCSTWEISKMSDTSQVNRTILVWKPKSEFVSGGLTSCQACNHSWKLFFSKNKTLQVVERCIVTTKMNVPEKCNFAKVFENFQVHANPKAFVFAWFWGSYNSQSLPCSRQTSSPYINTELQRHIIE